VSRRDPQQREEVRVDITPTSISMKLVRIVHPYRRIRRLRSDAVAYFWMHQPNALWPIDPANGGIAALAE
jgi:hypothetical protein